MNTESTSPRTQEPAQPEESGLAPLATDDTAQPASGDMVQLVERVRAFLADREEKTRSVHAPYDSAVLESRFGFTDRGKGKAEVILAEDMAVELGHPSTSSRSIVVSTHRPELVRHGQISMVGPDLDGIDPDERCPVAQVVMLAFRDGKTPDPFDIDGTQYLVRRLPGYMVRSVPGKLWIRISEDARTSGLTLETVGSALIAAYSRDFDAIEKVEVAFVTSCREDVDALAQIAREADILAGKHKKLALGADGEVECTDLNCETCDEKPVCDDLRDIVIKRRKRQQ